MRSPRHSTRPSSNPAIRLGAVLVALSHRHRQRAAPDRGASLVEWVIITAALIVIGGLVVVALQQVITDAADNIQIP
ncbi:MAG: hypothetical protein ACFCVF_02900 [Kineosporiaceae bacterium]